MPTSTPDLNRRIALFLKISLENPLHESSACAIAFTNGLDRWTDQMDDKSNPPPPMFVRAAMRFLSNKETIQNRDPIDQRMECCRCDLTNDAIRVLHPGEGEGPAPEVCLLDVVSTLFYMLSAILSPLKPNHFPKSKIKRANHHDTPWPADLSDLCLPNENSADTVSALFQWIETALAPVFDVYHLFGALSLFSTNFRGNLVLSTEFCCKAADTLKQRISVRSKSPLDAKLFHLSIEPITRFLNDIQRVPTASVIHLDPCFRGRISSLAAGMLSYAREVAYTDLHLREDVVDFWTRMRNQDENLVKSLQDPYPATCKSVYRLLTDFRSIDQCS